MFSLSFFKERLSKSLQLIVLFSSILQEASSQTAAVRDNYEHLQFKKWFDEAHDILRDG